MTDSDEDWTPEAERAMTDPPVSSDDFMVKWVKSYVPPPARVLDAGCLIGKWFPQWINHGYHIEGVDQCEFALKIARKRNPTVPVHLSRLQKMVFHQEFDLIYTKAVLQHNRHDYKKEIIERFWHALKPNKYLLIDENTITIDNYRLCLGGGAPGYYPIPRDTSFTPDFTDGYSFTKEGWIKFIAPLCFKFIKHLPHYTYYLFQKIEGV